jgi:hypothetical protein
MPVCDDYAVVHNVVTRERPRGREQILGADKPQPVGTAGLRRRVEMLPKQSWREQRRER